MRNSLSLSLAALAMLSSGCGRVIYDHAEVPPPAVSHASEAHWAQYCTYSGASDLDELNIWLAALGDQGWELVGVGGRDATVYCFKTRTGNVPAPVQAAPPPA